MTPARERLLLTAATAAAGLLALLASTQTWVVVGLRGVAAPLPVGGQSAAPALAPLGITVLAATGALAIAGRIGRRVVGAVLVLLGAAVVALGAPAVADPLRAVRGAVTTATGQGGTRSMRDAVARVEPGLWPAVAVAAGVAVAMAGVLVLVRAGRWPVGGRRYRADADLTASADPIDEWDAMSRGSDPTARGVERPHPPAGSTVRTDGERPGDPGAPGRIS